MTLAALIQKDGLARAATATTATVATHPRERDETVARVATVAVANSPTVETATGRWRVHYPDRPSVEVLFAPAASHSDVAALYPGGKVEPLAEEAGSDATPSEEAELRQLISFVLADATDAREGDYAEALEIALRDPEAALMSFRALAANHNSKQESCV